MIALLQSGVLWKPLVMMFHTLSKATHRVCTGFGDCSRPFFPPSDIPFQGCGQGNGAGPPIWVAVSAILIKMIESTGFGFECLSAISLVVITAQCFSFVDDTDTMEAARDIHQSAVEILPQIQDAALLWSGGIRVTRGAIKPDKSFWWLLDYVWDSTSGKWKSKNFMEESIQLEILDSKQKIWANRGLEQLEVKQRQEKLSTLEIYGLNGKGQPLCRLDPNQSERTLNVMLAPLEDHQAQLQFVKHKALDWSESICSGYLK